MKSVRAVNQMWRDETFWKWRTNVVFLINYETIPVLLKAFGEIEDFPDLTHLLPAEALARKDPFRLQNVPFRKYRFAKSQNWIYPLDEEDDLDRKLIWEKCINPNATYVDVGECILKACSGWDISQQETYYVPGLRWILLHSSQVTELALAPLVSDVVKDRQTDHDGFDRIGRNPQIEARPIWFQPTLTAPQVTTLTISSPSYKTGFQRFFQYISNFRSTMESFRMMRNLKNLKLPSEASDSYVIICGLARATFLARRSALENLNALDVKQNENHTATPLLGALYEYIKVIQHYPYLQQLKVSVPFKSCVENDNSVWFPGDLEFVRETLTKLEFRVDGQLFLNQEIPENLNFYFGTCSFPNLTHFKVQLDYKRFYGRLCNFDFTNLKRMPSLRAFYFGSKKCVERSWVVRKLNLVEPDDEIEPEQQSLENYEMADLKSFHFHGNFKKEAIQQLGRRITKNLETLELVFDKENWLVVKDIWPRLKNLKVLPCSSVREEVISELKESHSLFKVEDESNNWYPADWVVINAGGTSDSE